MALLALFAFAAGAGTALSPCVLPILPAVIGAGVSGGRRRPLGVITGLVLSFTFAIVGLVYVIDALGLPGDFLRTLAIVVLLVFGITLLVPPVADRVEAWISRATPALRNRRGEGFWSGFALGLGLGVVYAPCAGPILAGVITVSASQDFTAGRLAVAFAYALGSAVVLYAVLIGGRKVLDRLAPYRARIQVALGAVMIAVAVAMIADLDLRFQRAIAEDLPAFLRNPAASLEESDRVSSELAALSGGGHAAVEGGGREAASGESLPELGRAPELAGGNWLNTDGGEPLTMTGLRKDDQVVLVDFWTYTCINCIRTLPELRSWDEQYGDDGLTIVGVHTPEFPFERETGNVENAVDEYDIGYPVVQDNEYGTWDAFQNQYWPAKYLIDADGEIRYTHFGEGDYETTEAAIRSLLAEAGHKPGAQAEADAETADPGLSTPETYLGAARAQGWLNGPIVPGRRDFRGGSRPVKLPPNGFFYRGEWRISPESATAGARAAIDLRFEARRVFLVLGAERDPGDVRVLLDGKPLPDSAAGEDVSGATARIDEQRLYRLVDLPKAGDHTLTLEFDPGVSGYAFTFG
ncbi:MAG TPA: cytochrome c biogenesis protein DipZ [Solirubrobacterales bacterium]